jgi:redox-sensitive bicupin YhaK (pirin superfamily)
MIELRKAGERGQFDHGWLQTAHSFSFADYYDPAQMGWSVLRVINDDVVAPDTGFGTHGHRDMEIVTYMLSGTLRHGDSLENSEELRRPEVQRMSAGRGVRHSEFNASADTPAHLLQIWIEPDVRGIAPEYEQRAFPDAEKRGRWRTLVSPDGRGDSMIIHQDAVLSAALLAPGERLTQSLAAGRRGYVHVATGALSINGIALATGDGAKISAESQLEFVAAADSDILYFDLP